ncbi:MAG: hypothetical protein ACSHWW_04255 [Nonlabens sp.]|uniref:hypothetical protein n=1 Tax=Nonlabens sp. TaxID=1888209 RepID=UPI003EF8A5FF
MKNIKLLALIAFLTVSTTAMAQTAPGFGATLDDTGAPIPGIALAIAAAIGLGVVKLKRNK